MTTPQSTNPLLLRLQQRSTNPLREHVGPKRSHSELMMALANRPITPENVAQVPLAQRAELISVYGEIFTPTLQTLEIAIALQDMLFEGLDRRDPRLKENRDFIMLSAAHKGKKLDEVPTFQQPDGAALGMLIEGITGTGKSAVVERFLKLLPSAVHHGPNPSCGWASLKQLVYLRVHMPSDGTRGGFLTNAFLELDRVLGTNYTLQYKGWTIERQLAIFLHLLAMHRCGLLIIEEAQANALSIIAPYAREFLSFFLRLLNFGIPTVLIGNPLAFTLLSHFSQGECRFSESGSYRLEPTLDPNDPEWSKRWIPHLWNPTLLDLPDAPYEPVSDHPLDQTLEGFLWRRTGGFPRFLSRLRREVQARALALGLRCVTAQLVDEVFRTSSKFIRIHRMIEAFVTHDVGAMKTYLDIASDDYEEAWQLAASTTGPVVDAQPSAEPSAAAPVAAKKAVARKTSPKVSRKSPQSYAPEDIRSAQFQQGLIEQLKEHVAMG